MSIESDNDDQLLTPIILELLKKQPPSQKIIDAICQIYELNVKPATIDSLLNQQSSYSKSNR